MVYVNAVVGEIGGGPYQEFNRMTQLIESVFKCQNFIKLLNKRSRVFHYEEVVDGDGNQDESVCIEL